MFIESVERHKQIIKSDWSFESMGIGGLDDEFGAILRRAFASRIYSKDVLKSFGIRHVKGILLYGPPGTGKTLIARQISKMIDNNGPEPIKVNGPEILNKYVGASEENIRKLFEAAEKEQKEKGDDSHLHVIIFDEIDAICKQRGSNRGSTGVHDTVVNQLLSKLDGVDQLNNILVIGMTNRKDMIDEALLRPGRFEVHMPIGLPDHQGRIQIFKIKTKAMDQSGRLNKESIDWDILSNLSKNMSGAEIEGVVNHAISLAMEPALDTTSGFTFNEEIQKNLQVEMKHLQLAIKMNPPSYGINEHSLLNYIPVHYISYSQHLMNLTQDIHENILKLISSKHLQILSICLDGIHGTGKTSLAAQIALQTTSIPYIKIISPDQFVGQSESQKCHQIEKIFNYSYRSDLALIIIDNLERILEYVPSGSRISSVTLQTLQILMKKIPPHIDQHLNLEIEGEGPEENSEEEKGPDSKKANKKLMIITTSSCLDELDSRFDIKHIFNSIRTVKSIDNKQDVLKVIHSLVPNKSNDQAAAYDQILQTCPLPITIRDLVLLLIANKMDHYHTII